LEGSNLVDFHIVLIEGILKMSVWISGEVRPMGEPPSNFLYIWR